MIATMFVSIQAFGMGLDFMSTSTSVVEPQQIEEPAFGKFTNPKTIANYNRDWLVTVDSYTGDVFSVSKQNTSYDKFLFHINGRITAIHKTWYGYWVGNLDGASSQEGGSVELYNFNGKLRKKLFSVVKYASDIATMGSNIYVVDSGAKEVKVFNYWGFQTGVLRNKFMANPCNILIYGKPFKGVIYVSDNGGTKTDKYGNKINIEPSVMKFSVFRGKAKLSGVWFGKDYGFSRPRGMAVKDNILYIVDTLQGKLIGIDLKTNLSVNSIGEFGGARGQMISPKDMFYDRGLQTFYVIDKWKGSIEAVKEF